MEGGKKMIKTNQEIRESLKQLQKSHGRIGYPNYHFSVTQTQKTIKITWGYLDCQFEINKENFETFELYGGTKVYLNGYFDYEDTLTDILSSLVYYIVNHY